MSDTEVQTSNEGKEATEGKPRTRARAAANGPKAKLVRGKTYAVMFEGAWKHFAKGVETPVSPELKAYLEEHAVDVITVEGNSERRQKFVFA